MSYNSIIIRATRMAGVCRFGVSVGLCCRSVPIHR
jgi:hypothetical protein